MSGKTSLIQPEQIEEAILPIRGQRVMLDRDLAALYCVTTGNLNKAVRRNLDRFPADFMLELTAEVAEGRPVPVFAEAGDGKTIASPALAG